MTNPPTDAPEERQDIPPANDTPPANTPPEDVQEQEGEELTSSDPQALAKWQRREQRLTRERDKAREELATLRQQAADKEKQMAEQQAAQSAEVLQTVTAERDAALTEIQHLRLEKELTGKVADPEAAIKLMGDGFRASDGKPDVDAFLARYPYLKPTGGATAPSGAGGVQEGSTKESKLAELQAQLETATKTGNRALAVSLQTQITNLRQS